MRQQQKIIDLFNDVRLSVLQNAQDKALIPSKTEDRVNLDAIVRNCLTDIFNATKFGQIMQSNIVTLAAELTAEMIDINDARGDKTRINNIEYFYEDRYMHILSLSPA